jgi:hypothetical protein
MKTTGYGVRPAGGIRYGKGCATLTGARHTNSQSVENAALNCKKRVAITAPRSMRPRGRGAGRIVIMYARKLQVDIIVGAERRPCPLDWLDNFCMRNFTGAAEFDDTLPVADGRLEASFRVDPQRLAAALGEWFTRRGKGNGRPVTVEIREAE